MRIKDLKIGTKQMVGFGFILVAMTGVNIFSIHKMKTIKAEFEVTTNLLPRASAVSDINLYTSNLRLNQLQHALATEEASRQLTSNIIINLIDKINENLDSYESLKTISEIRNLYSTKEQLLFQNFDQKWDEYQALSFLFFKLIRDNQQQRGIELLNGEAKDVFINFSAGLTEIVNLYKNDVIVSANRVERASNITLIVTISLLTISVLLSIIFAIGLVRWITVPIHQLEKAAQLVTDGNLDVTLKVSGKDEIGVLSNSFNVMTRSLKDATEKLKRQANELREQAGILKTTNKELEEKSKILEKQKKDIVQKNVDLYATMEELKSTQEQLILKEKMASLGDLVAGVAHEINNPIGVVTGSNDVSNRCVNKIEIVLEQSRSIEKLKKNLELSKALRILKDSITITLTASNRIITIVKSLKNFARLDESEYQLADIHEGIESSLILMGSEFEQRISVKKEYGNIPKIRCYPGQLNQAFINLLKNARDAIEEHGSILIKTYKQNNRIYVQISDSGKGIPEDKLKRIFNFSISSEQSRIKMGSGLATAYNVVHKHDGEISVESIIGKGSTFLISIPISLN